MNLDAGFIPINRKLFDHPFWKEKRAFSKFEAWIDLLQTARYEDSIKTEYINSKPVKWGRGQLPGSFRYLMERWKWGSITKVETFIKNLQNEDMISLEKGQGINVITICKYDIYNPCKNSERTVKGRGKDSERTVKGRGKDETNKDNKGNKEIKETTIIPLFPPGQAPGPVGPVKGMSFAEIEKRFLDMFHRVTGRQFKRLNEKAQRQLRKLLTFKFQDGEFEKAVRAGYTDSLKWDNPSSFTPEYITRDQIFDKYLNAVNYKASTPAASSMGIGNIAAKIAAQNAKE